MSSALTIAAVASVAGAATSAALKPGAPKPAKFTPINQQQEQQNAIFGNMASLSGIQDLAQRTNNINRTELDRMLNASSGGYYSRISDSVWKNSLSMVNGDLPDDVASLIGRNSAAKSLYGGFGGSGMARNLTARDLGLTKLDVMSKGLDSATKWMAMTKAPQFNVSSMFVTPYPIDPSKERDTALEYANDSALMNFKNDPWNKFQAQAADSFGNALKTYLGGQNFTGSKNSIAALANETKDYPSPWG